MVYAVSGERPVIVKGFDSKFSKSALAGPEEVLKISAVVQVGSFVL